MKTLQPLIVTARVVARDLAPFDELRQRHFPPARNFLRAHLTMFHRLPGEHSDDIVQYLTTVAAGIMSITAEVSGVRHLGAGVAFSIASPDLQDVRAALRAAFLPWLAQQDMQRWQPHITVQNKVTRAAADRLHREQAATFRPHTIEIVGLDLWRYLNGPWRHEAATDFSRIA